MDGISGCGNALLRRGDSRPSMRSLGVSCIASSPLLLFGIGGEPFHQTPWVHDLLQERS